MKGDEDDHYGVLGVEIEASAADIRKAYRRAALKCHPDKHKGDQSKLAMFQTLSRAYEILSDTQARAAYDQVVKAKIAVRKRREAQVAGRRKMRDDLERRENEHRVAQEKAHKAGQEELAAADLVRAILRLRSEGSDLLIKAQEEIRREVERSAHVHNSNSNNTNNTNNKDDDGVAGSNDGGTIKVSWKKAAADTGYKKDVLHASFSAYGKLSALLVKNKTAIVQFSRRTDAVRFYTTKSVSSFVIGDGPKMTIKWVGDDPPKASATRTQGVTPTATATSAPPPASMPSSASHHHQALSRQPPQPPPPSSRRVVTTKTRPADYESVTLLNMRRAQEKQRLLKEMQAREAAGEDSDDD